MTKHPKDRIEIIAPDVPRTCRRELLETALAGLLPFDQTLERLFDHLERRA